MSFWFISSVRWEKIECWEIVHGKRGRGEVSLACRMLKVSPGAHALFQLLLVCKIHVPARPEYRIVSTFRGSLSAVHRTAITVTVLPVFSLPSSKVPSRRRGENMERELTWCSCSHALHLVSFNILQNIINKTTIKILWLKHDEQICTFQCYITDLSPLSLFLHRVSLFSFLDMELSVL